MAITVKSGFWSDSYSFIKGRAPIERKAAQVLKRRSMQDVRELMVTLLGATAGSTAAASYTRKQGVTGLEQGGVVTMESVDLVNRATTSQDVTDLNTYLGTFPVDTAIPTNGDGNPRGNEAG